MIGSMKKHIILLVSSLFFLSLSTIVFAQAQGRPFQDLQNQISSLQGQISNTSTIVDSFFDVFSDVAHLYGVDSFFGVFVVINNRFNNLQSQIDSFFDVFVRIDTFDQQVSAINARIDDICIARCGLFDPVCGSDGATYVCGEQARCAGAEIVPPTAELCDNRDNDCDGQKDESLVQTCYTGPAGTTGVGECKAGSQSCSAGSWGSCTGQVTPAAEVCDAKDNDCDGTVDQISQSCYTGPAGTAGVGECRSGTSTCSSGTWGSCTGQVTPAAEVCNGLDDDCNGEVDGGGVCPIFAGFVTNEQNPSQTGGGVDSAWEYQGLLGTQAGNAMCQAIGADHVCTYGDLVQARAQGELFDMSDIPDRTTIWLHRVTETVIFEDPINPGVFYTSPPGPGGRCNDWTFNGNHVADGEFAEFLNGTIIYHFDKDTQYTGNAQDGHQGETPSDGGLCAGVSRSIPCCFLR